MKNVSFSYIGFISIVKTINNWYTYSSEKIFRKIDLSFDNFAMNSWQVMLKFTFTLSIARTVSTFISDFSGVQNKFIWENTLSTGALLPGRLEVALFIDCLSNATEVRQFLINGSIYSVRSIEVNFIKVRLRDLQQIILQRKCIRY